MRPFSYSLTSVFLQFLRPYRPSSYRARVDRNPTWSSAVGKHPRAKAVQVWVCGISQYAVNIQVYIQVVSPDDEWRWSWWKKMRRLLLNWSRVRGGLLVPDSLLTVSRSWVWPPGPSVTSLCVLPVPVWDFSRSPVGTPTEVTEQRSWTSHLAHGFLQYEMHNDARWCSSYAADARSDALCDRLS